MSDPNAPPTTKDVLLEVARAMVEVVEQRRPYRTLDQRHDDAVLVYDILARLRRRVDDVPWLEYDEGGRVVVVEEVAP